MCHVINKRRVCACVAAIVVALTSLLCSLPASAAEPTTEWWSMNKFPYATGESSWVDASKVHVFVGLEIVREGFGSAFAANPLKYAWYQLYEGSMFDTYGYPEVYFYTGSQWHNVSSYSVGAMADEIGLSFKVSAYNGDDCLDNSMSQQYYDQELTYAEWFQCCLTGYYGNEKYCYLSNNPFVVRWTAKIGQTESKFAYFGIPVTEAFDAPITAINHAWYLGKDAHPAQAAYVGNKATADEYEKEIAKLEKDIESAESEIEQLEKDKAQLEDDKDFAWQLGFDVGKGVGYEEGYEAGSLNGGAETVYIPHDYIIDDTSWQSQVISFVAICFRGVRDFIQPFFDIEFFGFSVFDMLTVVVVGSLVVGVVLFILKFVRG